MGFVALHELLRQSRQRRRRRARTARLAGLGKRLWNQVAVDHTRYAVDTAPVVVLDTYEHAYHLDFGANAIACIDAVMRNVNWAAVLARTAAVSGNQALLAERSLEPGDPVDLRRHV